MTESGEGVVGLSSFMQAAGLHLDRVGPDEVLGWIELGPDQHQPHGLVHGGVYATAVETAASVGAAAEAQKHGLVAVGVNNTTNFLRSMTSGRVQVSARPLHRGRSQQLWEVRITDNEDRLVAIGQVRLQNVPQRS